MRKCCEIFFYFFNHSQNVGGKTKGIMHFFWHSIENCSKLLILKQADGPHKDYFLKESLYMYMYFNSKRELLLCMGSIGMCSPQGYVFSAILVINRVLSLTINFILNLGYIFCTLILNLVCFLEEATFSSLSLTLSTKGLYKLCYWNCACRNGFKY